MKRLFSWADPFLLMLILTVVAASLLPARGMFVPLTSGLADAGIVLLFFLHGAKLSREAIVAGVGHWRLHMAVLTTTFAIFPLLGLGLSQLPLLPPDVAAGFVFLTLLPSTVQSSIAFTAIARGNVAAAVCAASFSNLLGIALTPMLVALLMGNHGATISWDSAQSIAFQLLLPFVAGHAARPWIGALVARHKPLLTIVDRGSILLVVYSAFGAAVVEGIWHRISSETIALLAVLCVVLLLAVLLVTWSLGRFLGFKTEDRIVLLFCGSKKSLASGVPMAGVLFPSAQVGIAILPLMLFHQIQLIACAVIARRYAASAAAADLVEQSPAEG